MFFFFVEKSFFASFSFMNLFSVFHHKVYVKTKKINFSDCLHFLISKICIYLTHKKVYVKFHQTLFTFVEMKNKKRLFAFILEIIKLCYKVTSTKL